MTPQIIRGANLALGAPCDWDADRFGPCDVLHVRRVDDPDLGPELKSAWRPSPEELAALNAGGVVVLTITGDGHPPVMLEVEPC